MVCGERYGVKGGCFLKVEEEQTFCMLIGIILEREGNMVMQKRVGRIDKAMTLSGQEGVICHVQVERLARERSMESSSRDEGQQGMWYRFW